MNKSACSAVICQPVANEQKTWYWCPMWGPLHLTELYKYQLLVNQTQNSANPTQQLVVGSRPSRPSKYTKTLTGKVSKTVKVETVRKNDTTTNAYN